MFDSIGKNLSQHNLTAVGNDNLAGDGSRFFGTKKDDGVSDVGGSDDGYGFHGGLDRLCGLEESADRLYGMVHRSSSQAHRG